MVELAVYIHTHNLYTEQVQDFTPTPMSVSTCMYYTGLDPFSLKPVHIPKGLDKRIQRAILQYRDPKNRKFVLKGLKMVGREELIGNKKECLVDKLVWSNQDKKTYLKIANSTGGCRINFNFYHNRHQTEQYHLLRDIPQVELRSLQVV